MEDRSGYLAHPSWKFDTRRTKEERMESSGVELVVVK